jgi:uncharacterized protein
LYGREKVVPVKSREILGIDAQVVLRRYEDECLPTFLGLSPLAVDTRGLHGEFPLDVAATRGDVEEVRALLDGGALIDARGELGYTALHQAVEQRHIEVVRILLDRGASRTVRDDDGDTPLDIAETLHYTELVELLGQK